MCDRKTDGIRTEYQLLRDELRSAGQKITALEKSALEEARLRLLLSRIGTVSHQMSQPLMALMGTLSLIRINSKREKLNRYIDRIEQFSNQISDLLREIQIIRNQGKKFEAEDAGPSQEGEKDGY